MSVGHRWRRIARRSIWLVVGLLAAIFAGSSALWWTSLNRLENESSLLATTRGAVEVAKIGTGPIVLLVHGSPGGYDQLLPLARYFAERGFRGVTVSRPGYLRTALSLGSTPTEQADLLADVIVALGPRPAIVLGVSGAGPSVLHLALRHPDRLRALVLVEAVSMRLLEGGPDPRSVRRFGLGWDLGALAGATFPRWGLCMMVEDPAERARLARDPAVLTSVRYLFQSLGFSAHRTGYRNDMLQSAWDDLDLPLGDVRTPALVLHGADDRNVPVDHAHRVANGIPGAELQILAEAAHGLFATHPHWVMEQVLRFLRQADSR